MSKSIWCVMSEDGIDSMTVCLGCYKSEVEADKAWAYWDLGSSECIWIMETSLYNSLSDTIKELEME